MENLFKRKAPEKAPKNETAESKEKLPSNVKVVETEKAKFRIAYGAHDTEREPEELGKADAWIPETSGLIDYTLPKKQLEENFSAVFKKGKGRLFGGIENKKLFEKAEKEKNQFF